MAESRSLDVDEDEEVSLNELEDYAKSKENCIASKRRKSEDNRFGADENEQDRDHDKLVEEKEDPQGEERVKQEREEEKEQDYQEDVGEAPYRVWMHTSIEEDSHLDDAPACIKEILRYANSVNVCERQLSCRHLLETLTLVSESPDDVDRVFQIIDKLSLDLEPHVIAELIQHVFPIARFCYDHGQLEYLIADRLVPLLLKFLMAPEPQVRGNAQECLRVLRLQNLIDHEVVKRDICPVILNLTYSTVSSMDYISNAITLMTKMAPVLGHEATEEFFVPRIISLSMDSMVHVRKTCIAHFGEYCSAVSTQVTENVLLPYFIRSCYDNKWEVRKACAEVIMSVSCACQLETRKMTLAPVCMALLSDSNRSVRMAAFETLGPFITTFAEPSITGLAYNQHGQLVLTNWSGSEFRTTPKDDDRCRKYDEICGELNENEYSPLMVGIIGGNSNNGSSTSVSCSSNEDNSDNNIGCGFTSALENTKLRDYEHSSNENTVVVYNDDTQLNKLETNENDNISNENNNRSENHNYYNNTNHSSFGNNAANETAIDSNEDNLQQYNSFLYWRDPLPVLDEVEVFVSVAYSPQSLKDRLNYFSSLSLSNKKAGSDKYLACMRTSSLSSSSCASDEDKINQNICGNSDKSQSKCDSEQNILNSNAPSSSGSVNSDGSASIGSSNDDSANSMLNSEGRKIPIVLKGNESNKDDSLPIMEDADVCRRMLQMYDRLYSEFSNELTYKPIPVLPFSDSLTVRQDVGPLKVPGLCRKKPCEKPRQNIVPQELIDHFVSLSDPVQGNCDDNNFLVYQIAYSLPAVAQTLGKENWPLLKNVYEKLAADKTWKVRRAVASSIHELAAIVGQDNATQDLVPIFNNIIKDLDEVRIGALKHLAMFLKTLRPIGRNSFLPKLSEFLMTDCDMNWRFREELAEQLIQIVGMFSTADTYTHIMPLAIILLVDKVAAVRQVALYLMTELIHWISSDLRLLHSILVELVDQFARSKRWNRRQTFALLCSNLISQNVLPEETFAINVLPHLFDLSWDTVPNVRLVVARTLSTDIAHHPYFSDPINPHHEVVMQTLRRLQTDRDRDVQYLAFYKPRSVSPSVSDEGAAQDWP